MARRRAVRCGRAGRSPDDANASGDTPHGCQAEVPLSTGDPGVTDARAFSCNLAGFPQTGLPWSRCRDRTDAAEELRACSAVAPALLCA
eukprot:scaffold7688_cov130-Isochrysis_galbana.AAC.10